MIAAGDLPARPSTTPGSSRPISTKTKPLRTKPTIFQVVSHRTRLYGVRILPNLLPMTSPAATAASTPDRPSCSAGRYAANGMTSEITTSTGGSSSRRRISPATLPTTAPIATPPTVATTNEASESVRTNVPLTTATTATR